jgi:hypothetical protein
MKSPPVQVTDDQARQDTETFIQTYARDAVQSKKGVKPAPAVANN